MSEEREAARDGARLHRNSGRGVIEKGDASLYPFTVDYKEYTESFGVSRKVWAKCTIDALKMRSLPCLKLVLGEDAPQGSTLAGDNKTRLWVIGDEIFHEMREAWLEKYGDEG